jgi:hypothetical protein
LIFSAKIEALSSQGQGHTESNNVSDTDRILRELVPVGIERRMTFPRNSIGNVRNEMGVCNVGSLGDGLKEGCVGDRRVGEFAELRGERHMGETSRVDDVLVVASTVAEDELETVKTRMSPPADRFVQVTIKMASVVQDITLNTKETAQHRPTTNHGHAFVVDQRHQQSSYSTCTTLVEHRGFSAAGVIQRNTAYLCG